MYLIALNQVKVTFDGCKQILLTWNETPARPDLNHISGQIVLAEYQDSLYSFLVSPTFPKYYLKEKGSTS